MSAVCLLFYMKQALIVTKKEDKLLRELLSLKMKGESLLLESNEMSKPIDQIVWAYK